MSTATVPPKKPLAPPPPAKPSPATSAKSTRTFQVSSGVSQMCDKVVIYGPGGVGKTELCSLVTKCGLNPLFLDLESGSGFHDVSRIPDIQTWDELRAVLHDDSLWNGFDTVVVDSLTKAEELAIAWTLENVKHEKGDQVKITSIESYGFGKGYTHAYETFLQLLGDLDSHHRRGRHVICVAHECTDVVPNPTGEDWIRYEPRLQKTKSASIRHRVKEWCDHLLFVGFDAAVSKDGKATGAGTRTIYPIELPAWLAKSRSLERPIPYTKGSEGLWKQLLQGRTR